MGESEAIDLTNLDSWFVELDAPMKVLEYLTSDNFPLSPNNTTRHVENPAVLDLGTGNGSSLFELKLEGGYNGIIVGVDYSQQSVDLARRLWKQYSTQEQGEEADSHHASIVFEQMDLLKDQPADKSWWPSNGFDLVMDKGTFDAVSLSAETMELEGREVRVVEVYPAKVAQMVKPGGYLLITSVNWTEDEIVKWFTKSPGTQDKLQEYGRIKYPVYEFSGRKGQSVASICFHRVVPQ